MNALELLVPRPRKARQTSAPWRPGSAVDVRLPETSSREPLSRRLQRALSPLGIDVRRSEGASTKIVLALVSGDHPEAHRLKIGASGVRIEASSVRGLGHGLATLTQWMRVAVHRTPEGPVVAGLEVDDRPDLPVRGVMLDVSRNKVPKVETLRWLIEWLADLKINQLQLYTEHTFAYAGHEVVWRDADPLTPDDLGLLVRVCDDVGIDLVPNQNSFGHFHRWLIHAPYRPLAECPEGVDHPFSDVPEPFSLCPTDPDALGLLADLYDQLLPHFGGGLFNVGLDETLDLGTGRSAAACVERGKDRVYLEFLRRVHDLAAERGRRMLFWGDVILDHPERIPELPPDAIALAWGYEADHPFADNARRFAEAGLEFWLCPGTSSWNSLGGRWRNALANLASATRAARDHGARGLLITDWGDHGHLQPLPIAYPALLAGAAFAWSSTTADDPGALPVDRLLDLHLFDPAGAAANASEGSGLGRLLLDLGDVDSMTGAPPPGQPGINGSALFFQLIRAGLPADQRRAAGMTPEHLAAIAEHLADVRQRLEALRPEGPEAHRTRDELRWVTATLDLARRLAAGRFELGVERPIDELPRGLRRSLREALSRLVPWRRELWMARNRPGGWPATAQKLERLGDALAGDDRADGDPARTQEDP